MIKNLTNLEISKKLKEAGFEAETLFYWTKAPKFAETDLDIDIISLVSENRKWQLVKSDIPSYDLETLLDALPDFIIRKYKNNNDGKVKEFKERLIIEKEQIRYSCDDIENADDSNYYFREYDYMSDICVFKKFDENSLADTAGKMLIKLYEAGIINFKK